MSPAKRLKQSLQGKLSLSTKILLRRLLAGSRSAVRHLAASISKFVERVLGITGVNRGNFWTRNKSLAVPAITSRDLLLLKNELPKSTNVEDHEAERMKGIRVSIVIPVFNKAEFTFQCLRSLLREVDFRETEVIVVNNASTDQTGELLSHFEDLLLVIENTDNRGFVEASNQGAALARGEYLLFLNNDTEVITPNWIEALLEYAQQPQVGAVGARLLYPQGHPQHEGIIMGLGLGTAGNVDHGGYFSLGQSVLNASAVTAACMMTRSAVFSELGGFEKQLTVAFNDVDYCLRVRQAGYRVVYTPYAELFHYESASRGSLHPPADEAFFRERWGCPGEIVDPYYNPNLDLRRPYHVRVDGEA